MREEREIDTLSLREKEEVETKAVQPRSVFPVCSHPVPNLFQTGSSLVVVPDRFCLRATGGWLNGENGFAFPKSFLFVSENTTDDVERLLWWKENKKP